MDRNDGDLLTVRALPVQQRTVDMLKKPRVPVDAASPAGVVRGQPLSTPCPQLRTAVMLDISRRHPPGR